MNQETSNQEMEKQGWVMRMLTAVGAKLFAGIGTQAMGMSPSEARMFMYYGGIGWEEAMMYQAIVRINYDEELS